VVERPRNKVNKTSSLTSKSRRARLVRRVPRVAWNLVAFGGTLFGGIDHLQLSVIIPQT